MSRCHEAVEAAKPSQDPETISKATAALAQCLLDGAEEVL